MVSLYGSSQIAYKYDKHNFLYIRKKCMIRISNTMMTVTFLFEKIHCVVQYGGYMSYDRGASHIAFNAYKLYIFIRLNM